MKKFEIPDIYKSPIISKVKQLQTVHDPRRRNFKPTILDFGPVQFMIPRHFGFCYGVQNAIEIAYRTIEENPDKRIFFLSEMIHNPHVNDDLVFRGVRFIFEPNGRQIIPYDELSPADIVVVPAFGTTIETQEELNRRGIDPYTYDTTCPFVEKVWKRGMELGSKGYTNIIHGKFNHEETRATMSHVAKHGPAVSIRNPEEAHILADILRGKKNGMTFSEKFGFRCTPGFDPEKDLRKIAVINQTTMLASETKEIMEILRQAAIDRYGDADVKAHYAETSDTLCYATNENQSATLEALETPADMAFVVGGYNSSNTSHLVELCEEKMPTFFIKDRTEIIDKTKILHFMWRTKERVNTHNWFASLPTDRPVRFMVNSGASCPDSTLDGVIERLIEFFEVDADRDAVIARAFEG